MQKNPTLLVLAAGMGSRYGGLKQIDPMGPNGESVLDYSVFDAIRAGFQRVVFVIRKDIETAFKNSVGTRYCDQIAVDYAYQELSDLPPPFTPPAGRTKPWGTAHAVFAARKQLDGPFVIINADDFYGADAFRLMHSHLIEADQARPALAMIAYPLQRTLSPSGGKVNRGICEIADGHLQSVNEVVDIHQADGLLLGTDAAGKQIQLSPQSPVSMNFWGMGAAWLEDLQAALSQFLAVNGAHPRSECYLPEFVDQLIRSGKGRCAVMTSPQPWFGVTYPEDRDEVRRQIAALVASGAYPAQLSGSR